MNKFKHVSPVTLYSLFLHINFHFTYTYFAATSAIAPPQHPHQCPGRLWKKRSQKALLAEPKELQLTADEQKSEKDRGQ